MMDQDESWMWRAIHVAREAEKLGEVPVGAVIIDAEGKILAATPNRTIKNNDPTAHAEILALRTAAIRTGNYRLTGTTNYTTIEPCAMCAGALVNARVARSLLQLPKNDLLFPGDRLEMQYFKPSVIKRFSKDEIAEIIRTALNKFNLNNYPFEFNVRINAINGDQVYSENFFKYYADSSNSLNLVYSLEPPSGSNFENLVREELLYVIIPHQQRLVGKK